MQKTIPGIKDTSHYFKRVDPSNSSTTALIESPAKINLLIRPETKHLQQLEFIRNNGQNFSVLIDDDISEQKYKLVLLIRSKG